MATLVNLTVLMTWRWIDVLRAIKGAEDTLGDAGIDSAGPIDEAKVVSRLDLLIKDVLVEVVEILL